MADETTLWDRSQEEMLALTDANHAFGRRYPGESGRRQPIHTVYGGAQLYRAETPKRLGELARRALSSHAPDSASFARAVGMAGGSDLHDKVYTRMTEKLAREPVEDFRIDFEDGFGNRPDAEEDETARHTARELARAMKEGLAPPFIGIRVKPLNEELKRRSVRTLDLFVTTLLSETGGELPESFVVTLPKIPVPEQVATLVRLFEKLELETGLREGTLKLEMMIELTQSILAPDGRSNLPLLLEAAEGRCVAAHFGTYDYTASANITAAHQKMDHPACDFALHMMKVAYEGTGIFLSDGATNLMPVGESAAVHDAWSLSWRHIRHSLENGIYQGWDLHPAQLPIRYAATYEFFLEGFDAAAARLRNFVEKAAQATLVGDVFDDAATGQGLLNYFLRALGCGAITLDEVSTTGLTMDEIRTRSFLEILDRRRSSPGEPG